MPADKAKTLASAAVPMESRPQFRKKLNCQTFSLPMPERLWTAPLAFGCIPAIGGFDRTPSIRSFNAVQRRPPKLVELSLAPAKVLQTHLRLDRDVGLKHPVGSNGPFGSFVSSAWLLAVSLLRSVRSDGCSQHLSKLRTALLG